jgi:uncharacterized protein
MTLLANRACVETASGRYVDLSDPDPATILVEDIAHHLAQTNRYAGAARRPISVAEHALLVAGRLTACGAPRETVLHGLHHDDAEAFVGDVTRPLKAALVGYAEVEAAVTLAIQEALGLPDDPEPDRVKAADNWALSAEAYHLLPSGGRGWDIEGLYHPDDACNPPAVGWLLEGPKAFDAVKVVWLAWHEALS